MRRQALIFGSVLALLAIAIKWLEYRYIILDYTIEIYGGTLAIIFTILGIMAGRRLASPKKEIIREEIVIERPVYITKTEATDTPRELTAPETFGISKREFEILELMALGLSNQEIAEQTYLSIHTIKTHASNLFVKLDVKRRTQAVSRAKELKLLP